MIQRRISLIAFLHLTVAAQMFLSCQKGFKWTRQTNACIDVNECESDGKEQCGDNAECINTNGSFVCQCVEGYLTSKKYRTFTADTPAKCKDVNECAENREICGPNAICTNTISNYNCTCKTGFSTFTGVNTFHRELDCNVFEKIKNVIEEFHVMEDQVAQLRKSCLELTETEDPKKPDGKGLLKTLLSMIDKTLSESLLSDNWKVSTFLDLVEVTLQLVGPFVEMPGTRKSTNHTEFELLVNTDSAIPEGTRTLSTKHAKVDIQLEVAAGDPSSYPGFTTVSLLSFWNLEKAADGFFSGMENQSYKINSKVATVAVSNRDTNHLKEPVRITLYHLDRSNPSAHTCVYWDASEDGGTWSPRGCSVLESNPNYTVCSCNHLSSFAVLMALYEMENHFELELITWLGLSLSLICLFFCIATFSMIRSIKSPRTTIHLNLCISLFMATLIFLVGISQTANKVGCAVVAGMLHFFYLAAFCWMCLEGIQLFRMVVLVFNTNFKALYMMAGGYGVPAVIVAVSASLNPGSYGTKRYCWLNLDSIWSFFGPVCVIIAANIFFFIITVWKLAQNFSSLNPELDKLHKIKAFTITAVAQLCILGTMWIFGCFQFQKGTIATSYLFTIFGSLQGVMLFVMHCLFSKQVRDEYNNILSRFCAPGKKKKYTEFNCSQSSKTQGTRSSLATGESQI